MNLWLRDSQCINGKESSFSLRLHGKQNKAILISSDGALILPSSRVSIPLIKIGKFVIDLSHSKSCRSIWYSSDSKLYREYWHQQPTQNFAEAFVLSSWIIYTYFFLIYFPSKGKKQPGQIFSWYTKGERLHLSLPSNLKKHPWSHWHQLQNSNLYPVKSVIH